MALQYKLLLPLCVLFTLACSNNTTSQKATNQNERGVMDQGDWILLGPIAHADLLEAPFVDWYNANYKDYRVNQKAATALSSNLDNITFRVFMGTWCSDSQMYVPGFFKVMEKIGYDISTIKMVAVNNDKNEPKSELDGYEIEYVPTIIMYRNEKAIGRIVEYPNTTLEQDMFEMLKN